MKITGSKQFEISLKDWEFKIALIFFSKYGIYVSF
jgi:hypothetical protein